MTPAPHSRRTGFGFTLIELMITVAVMAILAAIAYPSYMDQVSKTRRGDAKAALTELSLFMERFYTENNRYDQDAGGTAVALPFAEAPKDGTNKFYDLTLQAVATQSYTLRATPKGGHAGDGYLELTQTGVKRWDADNSGAVGAGESKWL